MVKPYLLLDLTSLWQLYINNPFLRPFDCIETADTFSWKMFRETSALANGVAWCTILYEVQAEEINTMSCLSVSNLLEARYNPISYELYVYLIIEIPNIEENTYNVVNDTSPCPH